MTHLAIDALGARHGGAAVVAQQAVQAALRNPEVTRVTLFGSLAQQRRFTWPDDPRLRVVEPGHPDRSLAARVAWPFVGLRRLAKEFCVDRLLCLSNAGLGPRDVPTTVFVQQSLPYSSEGLARCGAEMRMRLAAVHLAMRASLERAQAVIVQTPTMRAHVEQSLRLAPSRVHVVPHDPGPLDVDSAAIRTQHRLLYVGSNGAYKNLDCLSSAVRALSEYHPGVEVACTLSADDARRHGPRWHALGYLDTPALEAHYRGAGVLVMPSLAETVGLPLLEAMRFGLPVVAADRPYAHDVCGESALFFDPLRPDSLARALSRVWSDTAGTAARVQSGQRRVEAFHARRGYDRVVSVALAA